MHSKVGHEAVDAVYHGRRASTRGLLRLEDWTLKLLLFIITVSLFIYSDAPNRSDPDAHLFPKTSGRHHGRFYTQSTDSAGNYTGGMSGTAELTDVGELGPVLPLQQFYQRPQLYALYADYVRRKRRHLLQLQLDMVNDMASPEVSISLQREKQERLLRERREVRYVLYVQRAHMRALRHADAMKIETLHFLRHLTKTIPALQMLWRGKSYCSWVGVTCHTYDLMLHELINVNDTVVKEYLADLGDDQPLQRSEHDSEQDSLLLSENTSQMLLSPKAASLWLQWNARTAPTIMNGFLDQATRLGICNSEYTEGSARLNHPLVTTESAKIFIGTQVSPGADEASHSTNAATTEGVDPEDSVTAGYLDQKVAKVLHTDIRIPVTMVFINLRDSRLSGYLPEYFHASLVQKAKKRAPGRKYHKRTSMNETHTSFSSQEFVNAAGDLPVHDLMMSNVTNTSRPLGVSATLVASPHDDAYWPWNVTQMETPYYHQRFQRSNWPEFPLETVLLCAFREVVQHLEHHGTATRHYDLSAYFSKVVLDGHFWGVPQDGTMDETSEIIKATLLNLNVSLAASSIEEHIFHPSDATGINRLEETMLMGEIEPRLVNVFGVDFSFNPNMHGYVPERWLYFPFLRFLDVSFTSMRSSWRPPSGLSLESPYHSLVWSMRFRSSRPVLTWRRFFRRQWWKDKLEV